MKKTIEEILDMVSEVWSAIFFISFYVVLLFWGGNYSMAELIKRISNAILGAE